MSQSKCSRLCQFYAPYELYCCCLLELIQEGLWVIDADNRTVYVNRKMADMLGYTVEEMDNLPVTDLIDKSDAAKYFSILERHEAGIKESLDFVFMHKSGRRVYTRLEIAPLFGKDEQFCGAMALVTDLTAQKETGAKLWAARNRLQAVVENISDVFVQTDRRAILEYVSPSCSRVLGFTAEEMVNKSAFDFIHPEDRKLAQEYYERIAGGESLDNPEIRLRHADGHYVWTEIVGKSVNDRQGCFSFAAFVIRDITERKKQERELLKAARLESIALIASGIAHDFNNLLAVVQGHVAMAKLSLNKPEQLLERLEKVELAAMQARDLSARLISFSKGDLPEKEIIRPAYLVEEAVAVASSNQNIHFSLDLPEDLHLLRADVSQLMQVFNNILTNAVQAMPQGGTVTIKGSNFVMDEASAGKVLPLASGDYVRIAISDQGPGIPPELMAKVFDPFFTTKEKGYGLGLATAHFIVSRHDGCITVEQNEEGAGTTFTIYLPAYSAAEDESKAGS